MTDHEKHLAVIRDYVHDPFGDSPHAVPLYSHDDFIRALNYAISALERLPLLEAKARLIGEQLAALIAANDALRALEAKAKGGE